MSVFPYVLRKGMAGNAIESFLNVFFMAFTRAPRFVAVTATAEHVLCLDQTGGCCRMAAAAGDILTPMILVHRFPRLTLAFMTQGT